MLLLNPGPVTLTERVRRSMLQTDLCHREREFYDLQDEARSRLLGTYQLDPTNWSAVLMTASGTGAVESMVANLVPENGRVLVVENGVYGERMSHICQRYRIDHDRVIGSWMDAPHLDNITQRLDAPGAGGAFTHLAIVHHETTTGRLNDLASISSLCRARGIRLLLDGVSSFCGEAIDFDDPVLAAVAATANKCLHGVPGVAFVITRRDALRDAHARSYYLDLARLANLQDQRSTPFTPAIHAHYALVEALREFDEQGGLAARHASYAALSEQVRCGLSALGVDTLLPAADSSVVLRAYKLPHGVDYDTLHDVVKQQGFVIYAGQGDLSKTLFRISTMGAVTSADMDRLIGCFEPRVANSGTAHQQLKSA